MYIANDFLLAKPNPYSLIISVWDYEEALQSVKKNFSESRSVSTSC